MGYTLHFDVVWASFDKLLSGLALGLGLGLAAVAIGAVIGLVAGFASVGPSPFWRRVAGLYVTVFRNLPILVIVLAVYFALPQFGIRLDKIESFIASLAVYAGAYLTEVFRAGLAGGAQGRHRSGARHRPHPAADQRLCRRADHVPQRASGAGHDLHLAVQG